ncbi:hypothetical protein WJX72_010282 [[Myrmecia] bisecta]|uniref:Enhancer of rudimentary homolog n=1 Tax=[Myrmecia] bisecta TaxID=41462 RepID=A0AAW1PPR6_9CHLO
MSSHTIILLQPTTSRNSRTWSDYDTVSKAMDGICNTFERKLKELNPNLRNITYDIQDLYSYIDNMPDMSALVYDAKMNAYIPCNKSWIKERAFNHLKQQAGL